MQDCYYVDYSSEWISNTHYIDHDVIELGCGYRYTLHFFC